MTMIDENLLRASFAGYRCLEPSDSEVARVVRRAGGRRRPGLSRRNVLSSTRPALAGAAAVALLLAGAYAVPTTRAAIDDVTGSIASSFGAYQRGEDAQAPGRPLGHDEAAPFYERSFDHHSPRVIAEAGGYKLYAYISPGGSLSFDLGETGVGMGFPSAVELSKGAIYVLGPGAMQHLDAEGHIPLFGIAAQSVTSVELEYESGPPLRLDDVEDGWVLLAEPARSPQAIVARDASGEVLERKSVAYIAWPQYTR